MRIRWQSFCHAAKRCGANSARWVLEGSRAFWRKRARLNTSQKNTPLGHASADTPAQGCREIRRQGDERRAPADFAVGAISVAAQRAGLAQRIIV